MHPHFIQQFLKRFSVQLSITASSISRRCNEGCREALDVEDHRLSSKGSMHMPDVSCAGVAFSQATQARFIQNCGP